MPALKSTTGEAALIRKAISGVRKKEASGSLKFGTNADRTKAVVDACYETFGGERSVSRTHKVETSILDVILALDLAPDRWDPPAPESVTIVDTRDRPNDFERRCPKLGCSATMFFPPDARAIRCHACQNEFFVEALRRDS